MPIARLEDRAVVRITGSEAAGLLQNVLTLDIAEVDRHGSGYGALLSPQGKILWDFVLHKQPDFYAADLRADQAEAFAKRLSLYKLRAKVEIAPAPDMAVFVSWGTNREGQGGEAPHDPRLAELGSRWLAPADPAATGASAADWHRYRIALAIPEGGIDFVFGEAFPHDAAMDSLGGVAFDKGCYIGQEVVSRMRHRRTARRRIVAIEAQGPLPEPGADVLAGGQVVGRLGSSAGGKAVGVARLDRLRAALDAGRPLHAGAAGITVALPGWATYTWPATASAGED
jgi:folate-binding protein YgfZ